MTDPMEEIRDLIDECMPKVLKDVDYCEIFEVWESVFRGATIDTKRFFEDAKYRTTKLRVYCMWKVSIDDKAHKRDPQIDQREGIPPGLDDERIEELTRKNLVRKTYVNEYDDVCEMPEDLISKADKLFRKINAPQDFFIEAAKWYLMKLYTYTVENQYRKDYSYCGYFHKGCEVEAPRYRMFDYLNTPKMFRHFMYTMKECGKL